MKRRDITAEKIEKSRIKLISLLKAIETQNGNFIASVWYHENHTSDVFVNAVERAGYIVSHKIEKQRAFKYKAILASKDVEPIHARIVLENASQIFDNIRERRVQYDLLNDYPRPEPINLTPIWKAPENESNIKDIPDLVLLDELRSRGYTGELSKIVKYSI